jgi:hypothetical protein
MIFVFVMRRGVTGVIRLFFLALSFTACSKVERPDLGARNAHAMAYDDARDRVILFGGADERSVRGDTWGWDGRKWHLLATEGPPARTFPVMASDARHGRVLLFGGNRVLFGAEPAASTLLRDLWAWDGRRWHQLSDGDAGPSARAEACGAYDERRQRFVVFGGYEKTGATRRRLGDTWEWDGTSWARVAESGPSPRNGASMTYVPPGGATPAGMVLFGGSTGTPPPRDDTWLWDGQKWSLLPVQASGGRFNPVMAYDEDRRETLRFGGWTGEGRADDFWRWRDDAWLRIGEQGPSPRNHSAWAYDRARRAIFLYGGHDGDRVFGDTWTWDGRAWNHVTKGAPLARVDNGH